MRLNLFPSGERIDWRKLCDFLVEVEPEIQAFQLRLLPKTGSLEIRHVVEGIVVELDPIALFEDAPIDICLFGKAMIFAWRTANLQGRAFRRLALERFEVERADLYHQAQTNSQKANELLELARQQLAEAIRLYDINNVIEES